MKTFNDDQPSVSDYLGDVLRGNVPPNQLIPQHPFILNTLQLKEVLEKNTEHIMLLTMDEAYAVADGLYNKTTNYAGNIKDTLSGVNNIAKLTSYRDAGKLVFNLKGLGIKAQPYVYKGVTYIKITGYASLRRIVNGTRYAVNNPKVLELSIGRAGIHHGIMSGARFCIYFSAAQRTLELIFSSEHDVATFIGNLTMDVAKVIVTIFITKIAVEIGMAVGAALFGSAVLPISVGIMLIVAVGFGITASLFKIDEYYKLSEKLISSIRKGMDEHSRMLEWNLQHGNHMMFSMMKGNY